MRNGLPVALWLLFIRLGHAQGEGPIKITISENALDHRAHVALLNGSDVTVTAFAFSATARQPLAIFDAVVQPGQELLPGATRKITFGTLAPADVQIAAVILSDGRTFGDQSVLKAIMQRRRATLTGLEIVGRHFPEASATGPLLPAFQALRPKQLAAAPDDTTRTAIVNINLEIQRRLQGLAGDSSEKILAALDTVLRGWEDGLKASLPMLDALQ